MIHVSEIVNGLINGCTGELDKRRIQSISETYQHFSMIKHCNFIPSAERSLKLPQIKLSLLSAHSVIFLTFTLARSLALVIFHVTDK